ncbi:MAG: hypothetical protein RIG77_06270 [Cyclobacteriaceae bacterium]
MSTTKTEDFISYVEYREMKGFSTSSLSFIEKLYGRNHTYYQNFNEVMKGDQHPDYTRGGIEILQSIKSEIEDGWIYSVKELISAEIFSDFLEMAEHLLTKKYKDPAAVIIGSVLEEHLRQLCIKNNIKITISKNDSEITKKADRLNNDLASAEVYNKLDQKSVTGWLDLRNKAAHGKYSEYELSQVELMYNGVLDFSRRTNN